MGDSGRTKRRLCLPDGAGARPLRAALRHRLPRRVPGRIPQAVDGTATLCRCQRAALPRFGVRAARRGVAGLFVATEALRGWRELCVGDDHCAATWVRFVARLLDTSYRDVEQVRRVMDHPGTHRVRFFYDHFPPTWPGRTCSGWKSSPSGHGSWLNMAEIEFAVLGRQALNRPFADKAAVQAAVERWKNRQNTEPKPRNWPFTTADARIKPIKLHPTIQCFLTTTLMTHLCPISSISTAWLPSWRFSPVCLTTLSYLKITVRRSVTSTVNTPIPPCTVLRMRAGCAKGLPLARMASRALC